MNKRRRYYTNFEVLCYGRQCSFWLNPKRTKRSRRRNCWRRSLYLRCTISMVRHV